MAKKHNKSKRSKIFDGIIEGQILDTEDSFRIFAFFNWMLRIMMRIIFFGIKIFRWVIIKIFWWVIIALAIYVTFSFSGDIKYFMFSVLNWILEKFLFLANQCDTEDLDVVQKCSKITRNFGSMLWGTFSLIGLIIGLGLAWWGRKIQQESHLQERYEKAANMLSSDLEATRIAACLSLSDLGKARKFMKSRCTQLLFAFINEPYLEEEEIKKYTNLKRRGLEDGYLAMLFPENKRLRPDIQKAIDGFSAIYQRYGDKGIDEEKVKLRPYLWKNKKKGEICLIKAYLQDLDLRDANLQGADLRKVVFENINLSGANLQGADLRGSVFRNVDLSEVDLVDADVSKANMREANNLKKEQILSAQWGYDIMALSGSPKLPKNLERDNDVISWLIYSTLTYERLGLKEFTKPKAKAKSKAKAKAKKARGRPRKKTS